MINYETYIGRIIHDKLPIEWMRYNMYKEEEKYKCVPMLVFRFHKSCSLTEFYTLQKCVDNFTGNMKWTIFNYPASENKYLLTISEMQDWYKTNSVLEKPCSQEEFWGIEKYKTICELAIKDIPNLAKQIEEALI